MLLLPHHHEYKETLANLPFYYKELASKSCDTIHILQKNPNYLPEMVKKEDLQEYLLGGEADQFVEFVDGYANSDVDIADVDRPESNDGCLLWELSDEWLGSI